MLLSLDFQFSVLMVLAMKTNKLFIAVVFILSTAWAETPFSAKRELGKSYTEYIDNAEKMIDAGQTAMSAAVYYRGSSSVGNAPLWNSYSEVLSEFRRVRDTRLLRTNTSFPRRGFWFYPDDGCYVRAALMNRLSYLGGKKTPGKVFAFGNLRMKTANSPRGVVGWWYHVAPIVQVGKTKYVFDPAMEISRPLTLDEWVQRMGISRNIRVSVCASGAYVPGSLCNTVSRGESYSISHSNMFLDREWQRLSLLKRDPKRDLGPNPPWYKKKRRLINLPVDFL